MALAQDQSVMTRPDRWVTRELAEFAAGLDYQDISPQALEWARILVLDHVACTVAGNHSPLGQSMRRTMTLMGQGNQASILGTDERATITNASLINGCAANALDFDDATGISHDGASVIPVALAIGEDRGISGREFLTAVVAGYEVGHRIGVAIQPTPERTKEVWFVGTWQALSAAVAGAKALGLSVEDTLHAYGTAGTTATVPNTQKWGWEPHERPLHWAKEPTGWAAWTGAMGAMLAEQGFIGNRFILDGPTGFWRMAGSDRVDWDRMVHGLGIEWAILDVGIKPFPCCRWQHSALPIVESLKLQHDLRPDQVVGVDVYAFDWLKAQETYGPLSMVDGQMSVPHAVTMLMHGVEPGPAWAAPEVLNDAKLIDWSRRVRVNVDPEMTALFHHREGAIGARVVIELSDGQKLEGYLDSPLGDSENPIPIERIYTKFLNLTSPILGPARAEKLLSSLEKIDSAERIADLVALAVTD